MAKVKISAVVNTRNEEDNIRYCLESVKWCDEIVVVDMESSDRTLAIAREYTGLVFTHPQLLAFDAARRFAVEKASGDWVLIIDADELVPRSLSEKLLEIAGDDAADIVAMPFKTYMLGAWIRHTGWWPEYHTRFFKRKSMRLVRDVHAFLQEDTSARKMTLAPEERFAVEHFAYRDSAHFVEKLNRYTTIEAVQAFEKGKPFSLFRMFCAGFRGFQVRYLSERGFRDGWRGFFLSIMMAFYRMLVYVKLRELYERRQGGFLEYERVKQAIIDEYRKAEPTAHATDSE
ncbi:MAG TPA: glycosyltransferase family 2 protein [Geobacteraceae bacterium]|nr:glycosyltransferase family 2 protein [Geobacteraceae bacterium]